MDLRTARTLSVEPEEVDRVEPEIADDQSELTNHQSELIQDPPASRRARISAIAMDTRPFTYASFRRLFYGNVLSIIGSQMTLVAVGIQVYRVTGSSAMVGYTSIFALIPLIVFGLIGGAMADTVDRRTLVIWATIATAITSIAFFVQSAAHLNSVWLLWLLVAVQSGAAAVYRPARGAMVPRMLPAKLVPAANTLSSGTQSLGVIIGPLIAGWSIGALSLQWTYLGEAILLTGALASLVGIPSMPPDNPDAATERRILGAFKDVWEGFSFLRTQPVLLMTFVVDLFAMVFGWPQAVFPALASHTFGAGNIGWLYAGASIGAVLAGVMSGWISRLNRHGAVIVYSIILWGLAIGAFAFASSLWLAILLLAIAGAADLVSASLRMTMLQVRTPDRMLGRMQGVFMVVVAGGPRLGDVRLGVVAAAATPAFALWSGGAVIVVAMLVVIVVGRAFWNYTANQPDLGR